MSLGSHEGAIPLIRKVWEQLSLPSKALDSVQAERTDHVLPSSFKIADLAQGTIALSALSAALVDSAKNKGPVRKVTVERHHAAVEFASERMYWLGGQPGDSGWGPLGGLHRTQDGHVRMHDSFINHRLAALQILGLPEDATKPQVAEKMKVRKSLELEEAAKNNKAIIYALRSYQEWDDLPQANAISDLPISIRKFSETGAKGIPEHMPKEADRCLRGLRVVELSRVIAGPVAGRTLAAHGADVLWVTSPNLPDLPAVDKDVSRGKRTIQLDLNTKEGEETLRKLLKDADVFIQSYRPGSLAARGFSLDSIASLRPGIIVANLSAWGTEGPWKENRGFDSIVQNVSGLNVSEAEHFGDDKVPSKALPVQALDHAAGYLLSTGIAAALYKRALEGRCWEVNVSLAGVGKFLRSLGQVPGRDGFEGDVKTPEEWVVDEYLEEHESGFGRLKAVKHSGFVQGREPGFDIMPKALGSDKAEWL